ncbi:uncharacterized protein LOC121418346 isoform X2 [Lytechinus variegatus]|uniref:uncharacterized protein LOC121418346 isoform X2 n=1 Tax=Lytechinus variegatus TaxID=7654 RepID=UPI001BB1B8CD|nr:uncharacterized protein LOC121418346 isoform X2 [Lytechinus variegatus]
MAEATTGKSMWRTTELKQSVQTTISTVSATTNITHSSDSNGRMSILWIGISLVVLAICIVLAGYGYRTYRGKLRNWKGIRRESEADSPISTSTHDRGGTSAISGRITGGSTRQNAVGSIDRSPSSNINPTITTIALSNVTQFAVPENTSEPLHTDAPPFLRLTGSNASSQTLPSLHQNNQRSINHYVSSPSAPNPYHYASSPDNSVDFVRLEAAYQEPSSVEIYNNAYEGTTDDVHSNIMLENVNPYHYATSSAKMEVGGGSTLSYEEAYQVPSAIEMANHEYEGTFDDHEHSTAVLSGGISMAYRPLPHRPSSANCNEGPTLPPRKSSRGPTHFPMKQRESTMDTVNNNFPQACSLVSKGLRHIPKKHQQEKEGMGQDMTPFYHTLEKDERARSLGQDNQGLYLGEGHLPHSAPISTNSQGNTIRSRVHGNTDLTDTDRMIDNVLYVPMTSCQKKYSHF